MEAELPGEVHGRTQDVDVSEPPGPARLLSAQQVAEIIDMSVEYVWALCRRDEIPHLRFGRHLRFRVEAVESWIHASERGTLASSEMAGRR